MMRRGSIAQAPRTEHDGAIPSGVQVGRRVHGYGKAIVLAGCSLVFLTICWSLRPPEPQLRLGHTHQPMNNPGFLFPVYRYHQQLHNSSHEGGFPGRRIRGSSFEVHGGGRINDGSEIEDFHIHMELGDPAKPFNFHIDTASGPITWVHCNDVNGYGSSLNKLGPNGMFVPVDHSVKCKGPTESACLTLQTSGKQDCDKSTHFDCLFACKYFDDSTYRGRVVNESITLPLIDKTKRKIFVLFGCAFEEEGVPATKPSITDGVMGLGNCKGTLMDQLWTGKHITRNVLGVCFRKETVTAAPAGFISLGMDFEEKFGSSVSSWVKLVKYPSILCAHGAKLLHIFVDKKKIAAKITARSSVGIAMYFDTGSDLTYLQRNVYEQLLKALDTYATNRAYVRKKDNDYSPASEQRLCWEPPSKKRKTQGKSMPKLSPYDDFEPLKLGFEGMDAAPVQYMIVQPVNYLVWDKDEIKMCVNILQDTTYTVSNLGGEIMKGNLFVFDVEHQRVRWTESTNCDT